MQQGCQMPSARCYDRTRQLWPVPPHSPPQSHKHTALPSTTLRPRKRELRRSGKPGSTQGFKASRCTLGSQKLSPNKSWCRMQITEPHPTWLGTQGCSWLGAPALGTETACKGHLNSAFDSAKVYQIQCLKQNISRWVIFFSKKSTALIPDQLSEWMRWAVPSGISTPLLITILSSTAQKSIYGKNLWQSQRPK